MVPRDELWKSILEDLFEPCVYFFYPEEAQLVDWSRQPEFLDKELRRIVAKSEAPGRVADKLVKIWLLDGSERWMLIHIEVQGYPEMSFARRMYDYRVRIKEKYGTDVVALAILTDESPSFRPSAYIERTWDNELIYRFRAYKLLDHHPSSFPEPDNPFSIVMETAFYSLRPNKLDDEGLLEIKKKLMRNLLKRGLSRQRVLNVLHFIDEYVHFGESKFQATFEAELDKVFKIEKTMSTYELVLKARRAEARKLRKEAMVEGRAEGRAEALRLAAANMLREGMAPEFIARVLQLEVEQVMEIQKQQNSSSQN